ncbi:MAG: DUF4974 domain-containing protein [Pseudosphingobacterium sp.]|nr:DUF4974 domain-containing protein [Pseudosphingobacterium sp.]
MENRSNLDEIFERYLNKECTPAELQELFRLFKTEDERALRQLIHNELSTGSEKKTEQSREEREEALNEVLSNIQQKISNKPLHRNPSIWLLLKAASVILFIGAIGAIGFYIYTISGTKLQESQQAQLINDALPGGNRAILTLADGSNISLDSSVNGMIASQNGVEIVKDSDGLISYKISDNAQAPSGNEYNTIVTPKGGQFRVELPDGSCVWLNSASSIKYSTRHTNRRVELNGEAYFQIQKKADSPFIVRTSGQEIQVLGTEFNVSAYENEAVSATTLIEGSVKVTDASSKSSAILRPGQQAFSDNTMRISEVDTMIAVAWKNDLFYFRGTDIKDVMRQLERWYDVEVDYSRLPDKKLRGTISRKARLSAILASIEQTSNVRFKIEGRRIMLIE